MTQAYPLHWPDGWPRTKVPGNSQFKTTLAGALRNVQDSIRRFSKDTGRDMKSIIISSNYSLGDENPTDGGVALYFTWDNVGTCIAVDRYRKLADNLQAIHHVLEAERTKMRHGGLNIVRAAFRGYAALPPPGGAGAQPWRTVLGVEANSSLDAAEAAFRQLARQRHPDRGGSDDQMAELNSAIDAARRELGL